MGLKEKPRTGIENYALLEELWKVEKMKTFRDFLRWYNNKDVVPTLQAMKKMMKFLSRSENWYVKAWLHATQFSKYLSS